jgi:predicted enzyme involved in methoxymalonyl-ACP biosynthesis
MGRGVEDAFVAYLFEVCRARGAKVVRGVFVPTAKNAPVAEFYATHGFRSVSGSPACYERNVDDAPAWPTAIARSER